MRMLVLFAVLFTGLSAQGPTRRPLSSADIDNIARLVMLEDTRQLNQDLLAPILKSAHPEVRRRAAIALGRIAKPAGGALLASMREDSDPAVAAAVVFATGQLRDAASVPWLMTVLSSTKIASAREAAIALGKIQAPEARAALAQYLQSVQRRAEALPAVGEALLSIGRFPGGGDLQPILRWTRDPDVETRWRAAWALFRPRDPAAFPELLRLSNDPDATVRFWSLRGLTPPAANAVNAPAPDKPTTTGAFDRAAASARLRAALKDDDRRVRTEALRALALYDDDQAFAAVVASLDSEDTWLSVSAAESIGRYKERAALVVPKLVQATAAGRPLALRITALTPLAALAPDAALEAAAALARESSVVARGAARQVLGRLGSAGKERLSALGLDQAPTPANPLKPMPPKPSTEADYRQIVERWIVPAYQGARAPRAVWETPRGTIELELYPGDAPLGTEHFVRMVESGATVATEFGRVVPNFVAQQRAIRDDVTLRDEVNQHGLTRGNLSWASAGLDTGRPGYTLGITPQPHNEGNFTALGKVIAGMDVVERLELGDAITAARMVR